MKSKNKKHTAEERAEEVIRRFEFIGNRNLQIQCALQLSAENEYVHGYNGPCYSNTFHLSYWERVTNYLKKALKESNG